MLYLVGTMDEISTYMDVVYLWYFDDLKRIHEYNYGDAYLVYM